MEFEFDVRDCLSAVPYCMIAGRGCKLNIGNSKQWENLQIHCIANMKVI